MLVVEIEAEEEMGLAMLPEELLFWLKKGDRGVWTSPVCRLAGVVAVACEDSEDSLERDGARSCLRVMWVRFIAAKSGDSLMAMMMMMKMIDRVSPHYVNRSWN